MNFKQVREFFIFTHKERNGLLVLIFLLLVAVCSDFFLPYFIPEKIYDVSDWKIQAENYYATVPLEIEKEKVPFEGTIDPNAADLKVLLKVGIPGNVASNWIKYLQKGGRFHKREDLKKLYGMNEELFKEIEGHFNLPVKIPVSKIKPNFIPENKRGSSRFGRNDSSQNKWYKEKKVIPLVEINFADSAQLEALPGIGPVLASRIIKYRKLLGGYNQVEQLKEIYGMPEELYRSYSPFLIINPSGLIKLEINFLSISELGRHPYIGFRQAKKLIKKRDTNGKFKSTEELITLFSVDSLKRLLPYISIDTTGL
jgi:DNA uptake protein ComE-like DNA-binding protein